MNRIVMSCDTIIMGDVIDYFHHRGYVEPTKVQAFLFLISEIGEIAELLVEKMDLVPEALALGEAILAGRRAEEILGNQVWVRNNPDQKKKEDIGSEIGDALMMLYKFAEHADVLPFTALVQKMESKGWKGESSGHQI